MPGKNPWLFNFEEAESDTEVIEHHLNIEVPMNYVGVVLFPVIEMILNMRCEGKRVLSENTDHTTSLKKVTTQKSVPETAFTYEAIANPVFWIILRYIANEFKRNIADKNAINEDYIYLNFYFINSKSVIFVWETWIIKILVKPGKTLVEIEEHLKELSNFISQHVIPPYPPTYSVESGMKIFQTKMDEAWPYRFYFRHGNNEAADHAFTLAVSRKNVGKVLHIIFQSILCMRCSAKLMPSVSCANDYERTSKLVCKEYAPLFDLSYARIDCADLKNSLTLQAFNCQAFVEYLKPLSDVISVFMSFYQLLETDSGTIGRNVCEKWKVDIMMENLDNITVTIKEQLENLLDYICDIEYPDSLRVPPNTKYNQLHKYYQMTLNDCSPLLFYVHF